MICSHTLWCCVGIENVRLVYLKTEWISSGWHSWYLDVGDHATKVQYSHQRIWQGSALARGRRAVSADEWAQNTAWHRYIQFLGWLGNLGVGWAVFTTFIFGHKRGYIPTRSTQLKRMQGIKAWPQWVPCFRLEKGTHQNLTYPRWWEAMAAPNTFAIWDLYLYRAYLLQSLLYQKNHGAYTIHRFRLGFIWVLFVHTLW